ncbi:SIS domain-containing protein [Bacillus sp. es.036]|uniref:SIS domain-containing protein n=1 Tax=Bacillus sp. es.036 TaxID=1761764 RepID=UPI000BF7092E|nr:SIS domain-containing protein [Bacillus sp. es.036]PFG15408.1 putative phosphosugar-binding protein [Bacillus sp. es.036]
MFSEYFNHINQALQVIEEQEVSAIKRASSAVATSIENGQIVHVFGCGHSHMMAEEVFYRAGGLAPIRPILIEDLMLHRGGLRSSALERTNDLAKEFMAHQDIQRGDVVIVVSTSGRNPVPIDVALLSKERGAYVIGVTSRKASIGQTSRHHSGKYLYEMVDLVIDHQVPSGDATMHNEKNQISFGSTSTILGMAVMNGITVEAIQQLIERGIHPPVFKSGNVDGSDEWNQTLIKKYKSRIPLLESKPHS